jgi:hypothetical protein
VERYRKIGVTTLDGPMTIIVSRNRVHPMGMNGFDGVWWVISWCVRLVTRDQRLTVSVRRGTPELPSGSQELLYSTTYDSRETALSKSDHLAAAMTNSDWPPREYIDCESATRAP